MLERILASFISLVLLCIGFAIGSNRHHDPSGNILLTIHTDSNDTDVSNESIIRIAYSFTVSTNDNGRSWSFVAYETNHYATIAYPIAKEAIIDNAERARWSNYFLWMTYTNHQPTNP